MITYLINLTGVNIFDEGVLEEYTKLVKGFEDKLVNNFDSLLVDSLSEKTHRKR